MRAIFGPPRDLPVRGGATVAVYVVPVFEEQLVAFDVAAGQVQGRWLPWAVMDFGQNPYEAASILADDWLGVPLEDLRLADVISTLLPDGGWELAIVFRAELGARPTGDADRRPHFYPRGHHDAFASFEMVDIERWVRSGPAPKPPGAPRGGPPELMF